MPDFTAHRHPVLAVRCPECGRAPGVWCRRPSGHMATDLHQSRKVEADRVFIDPRGRVGIRPRPEQLALFQGRADT